MSHAPFYFLSAVCSVASLLSIWRFGIRPHLVDRLRDRLFSLRFELLELAISGQLSTSDDAYRSFENLFNALLRHAPSFNARSYYLSFEEQQRARREDDEYLDGAAELVRFIKATPPETQVELTRLLNNMQRAIFAYIATTSALTISIAGALWCRRMLRTPIEVIRIAIAETVEREALRQDKTSLRKNRGAFQYITAA